MQNIIDLTRMKIQSLNWLKMLGILPCAALGYIGAFIVLVFLEGIIDAIFKGEDTIVLPFIAFFASGTFVICGTAVAPKNKKFISIILTVIIIAFTVWLGLTHVSYKHQLLSIFTLIANCGGAVLVCLLNFITTKK
jgi:hypothetical protein